MQFLHTLAASTVQSCQFFESTLPEQLFELKNGKPIKKSENIMQLMCYLGSIRQQYIHGLIQSHETFPLN
jgi:hypothetical protein